MCIFTHIHSVAHMIQSYTLIWTFFFNLKQYSLKFKFSLTRKTHKYYFTVLKAKNILPFKYDRPLFERHFLISEMLKCEGKKKTKTPPLINNDTWFASWWFFSISIQREKHLSWQPEAYSILSVYPSLVRQFFGAMVYLFSIPWCYQKCYSESPNMYNHLYPV